VIEGFEIGHHTADGDGWLTGTTVVLSRSGAVGGVDVRGGGPGTRETDLLDPTAMIEQVHAVVLTGGSAYGLAAADGVMGALEEAGLGFPVGPDPFQVVPIVPAAVIFDLGRGGVFGHRPTADFGARAVAAATSDNPVTGCVGGGTGASCGGLKGGFGYAEHRLDSGVGVAVAVVVNATGSAVDPLTGRLWADRTHRLPTPTEAERSALQRAEAEASRSLATTIAVLLTDATLTKAQAGKVAAIGHDGMARAIRPLHSMSDGDTVFCLASGRRPALGDPRAAFGAFNDLLSAAADVFTDACLDAVLAATGRGPWPSYCELAPSVASG
jgi:L-aminopeptidase/D-esterase-like protein